MEPQGPYYYRSATDVGEDLDGEGKDYYWKESWVDSREREPASEAYMYYYAAELGEPPDGHVSQYNDYRWVESSLSYSQNRLLKIFWGGDVIHNQTYSSIPSSVIVGNSTYHRYAGWTSNAQGTHYSVYRVIGAGTLPVGTTENTRKVEVYWKGVKRVDITYEWNGYGLPSYLQEGYNDYKWSHSTNAFQEIVGQDRNTKWYSDVTYQKISGFTRTDYNYNLPAKPPKPLVAVDRDPYEHHEPGEADYYLFGLRLLRVDDQSGFDQTSKTSAPFAVNCAVSIQFPFIKRVQAGVYEVNQATYNAMRHGTWTGDDRTYVHTLDKTKVQRVRHRYSSNGKYYFRTDEYYSSSGITTFSASDVIYYSDTRYTCHYLGGADFYGYNSAYPKSLNYIGRFNARQGDYIFRRSKPDDWFEIDSEIRASDLYNVFQLTTDHNFTKFLGYNDMYYSKQPQPNKFPINWSPPGGVSNYATNYDNYAIYPLYGHKEYRAEFPFDTEPAHQFHGTANNARPGLTGPIAPQQHEVLELSLNRAVPATSYTFNKGHHNSGFCVVPYGDGFGFTVNITNPKDTFLLNVINNHSWHSVTTELTNCTLIGDKNSSYNFTVVPIKTGEHFLCEIKYRNRAQSGGAYVNFHFVVKGFAMSEGGTKTVDINDTQPNLMGAGQYNITAEQGDVAGDSLINLMVTQSNWQAYTDELADAPQEIKIDSVENCIVLDDYAYFTPPAGVGYGGPISLAKPIRILPTADNWTCRFFLYFGWAYLGPFKFDNRYYPDMGMQVWNEAGGTRLNSSSRHPRIIYTHEGVIDYPVNLTVSEFLCHFNDVPFVEDMRQHRIRMLSDGNQYDSIHYDDKKFGAACIKIDRSEGAQAFEVSADEDFDFGTGDYTIDFWFKPTEATGTIIDMRIPGGNYSQPGPRIYIDGSDNIKVYINGLNRITVYSYNYTQDAWNHFALVRSNSQAKAYINGAQAGSVYTNGSDVTERGFRVGTTYASEASFSGRILIDELRILKGIAFYTSNFTPASSQYMGNNDVTLDSTDIPELVELVDDGTWHVNLTSEKGLTHVDFDYENQEVRISKNLPAAGNVRYSSWKDYARFQIMRL